MVRLPKKHSDTFMLYDAHYALVVGPVDQGKIATLAW